MKLIKNNCKAKNCKFKNNCLNLPVEVNSSKQTVDILFVYDYPKKDDSKFGRPLYDISGQVLRNIIDKIQKELSFTYAITTIIKNRPKDLKNKRYDPLLEDLNNCKSNIYRELSILNPKIIVTIGYLPYQFFTKQDKININEERGCIRSFLVNKKKQVIIGTCTPYTLIRAKDPNVIGILYEDIWKAAQYVVNDVKFNIPNTFKTVVLTTIKDIKTTLTKFKKQKKYVAIDTETENLYKVYGNTLLSIQFCNDGETGYVIPISHFDSPFSPKQLIQVKKLIAKFMTCKKSRVKGYIFHNTSFDIHQIYREMHILMYNAPVYDTQKNVLVLEENLSRLQSIKPTTLAYQVYQYGFTHYKTNESMDKEKRVSLYDTPLVEWQDYASADSVCTYNLFKVQLKIAKYKGYKNFFNYIKRVISPASYLLAYIEHCGLPCDQNNLRALECKRNSPLLKALDLVKQEFNTNDNVQKTLKKVLKSKTGSVISLFGNPMNFNPGTKIHKETLFFDILKLEPISEGKTGPKLDKEFQKAYKHIPEVHLYTEYNIISKLYSTYVKSISKFMSKTKGSKDFFTDSRIRPSFNINTVTGRLTSHAPNSQARPSRGDRAAVILTIFTPKKGRAIIKLDFKVHEVRGLQLVSSDPEMAKSFNTVYKIRKDYRKSPKSVLKDSTTLKDLANYLYKLFNTKDKWTLKSIDKLLTETKLKEAPCSLVIANKFKTYLIEKLKSKNKSYSKTTLKKLSKKIILTSLRDDLILELLKVKTDVHIQNAAKFFNKDATTVTKEDRNNTKGLIFGTTYGMSDNSLANILGTSLTKAKQIKEKVFSKLKIADKWLHSIEKIAEENLFIEGLLGRRRHLWGFILPKKFKSVFAKNRRLSRNSLIQGFSSDFSLIAGYLFLEHIFKIGKGKYQVPEKDAWLLINLIHDSCEMEVPVTDIYEVMTTVEKSFTKDLEKYLYDYFNLKFDVHFEVDVEAGLSFSKTHKWLGVNQQAKDIQEKLILEDSKRI